MRGVRSAAVLVAAALTVGCGKSDAADAPATPTAGVIHGKVTGADGKPIGALVKDIAIVISGVSEAAEKVSYTPAVKADGTYKQKVSPGQYVFNPATITVTYNDAEFRLPLEPVGGNWNKNQDAADGIVQDFVWKPTGATPYGASNGKDPGNATHWYGLNVGIAFDGYRDDIGKVPVVIPDKSKLTFTLKPAGKAIDGSEPKPLTLERTYDSKSYTSLDLNDLLPAPYELTGTVTPPDGTTKPLLLQGKGDYPGYKSSVKITVEQDNILGRMWKQPVQFVME